MKKYVLLGLIGILFVSCSLKLKYYDFYKWNFDMVDRIVQNPDSLKVFFNDSNKFSYDYLKGYKMNEDLIRAVINKIKVNEFKIGYTYKNVQFGGCNDGTCDILWMLIISDKTGKKVFFTFRKNTSDEWKVEGINLGAPFGCTKRTYADD